MEHKTSNTPLVLDDKSGNTSRDDGVLGFECPICLETCDSEHAIQVDTCGHVCCQDCLKDYCAFNLSIRKVPVPCPVMMESIEVQSIAAASSLVKSGRFSRNRSSAPPICRHTTCSQFLSDELVQEVLLGTDNNDCDSLWTKYTRLNRLVSDSSLVVCTRCDEVVAQPSDTTSNARSCPSCHHVFCAVHGDAHLGSSCENHNSDPNETLSEASKHALVDPSANGSVKLGNPSSPVSSLASRKSDQTESSASLDANNAFEWGENNGTTKPCSHCKAPIHKSGGCDHIVCVACHNDMCFQCGTHEYLSGKLTRFCSQCRQGYLDHRYLGCLRIIYCVSLPFLLPVFAIYSVLALIAVLLSGCCCGLFCCGADLNPERRFDPLRALIFVGCILILPLLYMLYDVGLEWSWLQDMVDLAEGRGASNTHENNPGGSHTLSVMEEGGR